jgi:hypothetical protein
VQILFFTDNAISSSVHVALSLPAPPICAILPNLVSAQGGTRLEQNILFRDCQAQGNATVTFSCNGCGADQIRLTVVCP